MTRLAWQSQSTLRNRLNRLAQRTTAPTHRRLNIDTTGRHFKTGRSTSDQERFVLYGKRRHETVARLCALFEEIRKLEKLDKRARKVQAQESGVVWQAFAGVASMPACHTSPTHLNFDGHLPTLITRSVPLRQHLIFEFADCMLMPASINKIDGVIDAEIGRQLFAATAELVLNESGATWRDGVEFFMDGYREPLGGAFDAYTSPSASHFKAETSEQELMVDMAEAYYEGLFLHSANEFGIANFQKQVKDEIAAGP